MSNVLIGIIGVILFIGLALAGALFLGSRFQEATNSSKASAAIQAVTQVSNAANMYVLQEGKDPIAGVVTPLVGAGYLKSVPVNPVWTSPPILVGANGSDNSNVKPTNVLMSLGANGRSVCAEIIRQTGKGRLTSGLMDYAPSTDGVAGCRRTDTSNGSAGVSLDDYVIYIGI